MVKMKLLIVLLFIGIIVEFSEEKPTSTSATATPEIKATESYTTIAFDPAVTEFPVTLEPEEIAETVSPNEMVLKNSSEAEKPPQNVQLPVDLLSDDILLDPSVILARAERSAAAESSKVEQLSGSIGGDPLINDYNHRFDDGIPTFYFVRYVRNPRSIGEPEEIRDFQITEEPEETVRRFARSAEVDETKDLYGAEDGFIIRPFFKYRHEQLKRSNSRKFRNRDSYYFYPRYPIFPGK